MTNDELSNKDQGIAIVIPCYNHAKELVACLESLTQQTLRPAEVLVIDNASEDHPEVMADRFKCCLPVSVTRFTEKQGAPAARNHGAGLTHSPRLIFLDADVVLEPDALAKLSEALDKNAEADFAYSSFYWDFKKFPSRTWDAASLHKMNYIHTTSLIRRKAFPGFDESLKKFQDWDLWLTMAKNGAKGVFVDKFLFRVRQRSSGISTWLPSFVHKIPWPILGWMPKEIRKYREAEKIIREKHKI